MNKCKICDRDYDLGDDPIMEYQTCNKCRAIIKLLYDHTIWTYPGRSDMSYIACDTCKRIVGLIMDPNVVVTGTEVYTCGTCRATPP